MNILVQNLALPNTRLSNFDLENAVKQLGIQNFRGVFCRDDLPPAALKHECGILNLDDTSGSGTHWVCWFKNSNLKIYFDSYGIQPPLELINYLKKPIYYNTDRIQPTNTVISGHLCLYVLKCCAAQDNFQDIINSLIK